jgi:hypothetical protein
LEIGKIALSSATCSRSISAEEARRRRLRLHLDHALAALGERLVAGDS